MKPGTKSNSYAAAAAVSNLARLVQQVRRLAWLYRIRPQSLAVPLYRLARPDGGRAIIDVDGTRLYIDPFTTHGMELVSGAGYEREVAQLIMAKLPPGGTFVDIGANEGIIAATAACTAGSEGLVIAVEPQQRLRDILEINLALNASGEFRVISAAITEQDGQEMQLNLGPASHSGGSSLVRAYRWGGQRQRVTGRSVDSILSEIGERRVDLMKVDVEGFEPEVIRSARLSLAARRIATLAVDFHGSILSARGIDPASVDAEILAHGYRREAGNAIAGYAIYVV